MNKIKFLTIAVISTLSICINSTSAMNNNKKEDQKNSKTNNLITTNTNDKNKTKNNINSNSINLNKINSKQNEESSKINKNSINLNSINLNKINSKQNEENSKINKNSINLNSINLNKINSKQNENNLNSIRRKYKEINKKQQKDPEKIKYETNNNQNTSINLNLTPKNINEQNKIKEDEKGIQNLNTINIKEDEKEIQNLNTINIKEDEKGIQNLNTININEQNKIEKIEPKEEDYDSDSSHHTGTQNPIFKCIEINEENKKLNKEYEEDEENEIEFNENEQSKIKEINETIEEIMKCFGRMTNNLYFVVQRDVCEDFIHMRNTTFQNPITQKYEHFCIAKNSEALFTNLIYSLIHNIVIPFENTVYDVFILHNNAYNNYLPNDNLSEVRLVDINVNYGKKIINEDNLTEQKIEQFKKERINECKEYIKKLIKKIKDHILSSEDEIISRCLNTHYYESYLYNEYFYKFSTKFDELKQAMEKFKKIIKMCYEDEKLKDQLNKKFKKYVKKQNDKQAIDGIGFLIYTLINNKLSLTDLKSKNLYIGKDSKYEMFHKNEIEKNNELLEKTNYLKQKGDDIIKKENKNITEKELIEYCDNYVKIGEYIRVLMDISIKNLSEENTYTTWNLDDMILECIKNTFKSRKFEIPEEAFDI